MAEDDEDSYWNESKAKGFSWDDQDDTVGLPAAISISSASTAGGDDLVSFDAGAGGNSSAWADRVREAVRQISLAANKPEPSLSQVVGGHRDPRKVEAELSTVRSKLVDLQANRFAPCSPIQTVRDMILGSPFSLEGYRSLQDKEALLDAALEFGDGDAILAVTIMLKNTLKRSKFLAVLGARQVAADQLVSHLVMRLELGQVVDLLQFMDRGHQAGVVSCRQAMASNNLEIRVRNLKQTLGSPLLRGHLDSDLLVEQINLCERLAPVISAEVAHVEREAASLAGASVLKTLLYLSTHYYGVAENLLHSPGALRKMHRLTDKQFTWVSLRARASLGAWGDCESLVVGKGWLGGKKAKGGANPSEVVTVLAAAGAPTESLTTVLGLVEGVEERLALARKVGAASVVVDVLVGQKDRLALLKHQQGLAPNCQDWFYVDNALRNSNVKWKN